MDYPTVIIFVGVHQNTVLTLNYAFSSCLLQVLSAIFVLHRMPDSRDHTKKLRSRVKERVTAQAGKAEKEVNSKENLNTSDIYISLPAVADFLNYVSTTSHEDVYQAVLGDVEFCPVSTRYYQEVLLISSSPIAYFKVQRTRSVSHPFWILSWQTLTVANKP